MEGIELEGEGPSFGISIVLVEEVGACGVGPVIDRFPDEAEVEEGEEGGFARPDVSLDGDYSWHFELNPPAIIHRIAYVSAFTNKYYIALSDRLIRPPCLKSLSIFY